MHQKLMLISQHPLYAQCYHIPVKKTREKADNPSLLSAVYHYTQNAEPNAKICKNQLNICYPSLFVRILGFPSIYDKKIPHRERTPCGIGAK
jgi:hypothetical protein